MKTMTDLKLVLCSLALALLAGCNTMSGMGKDIKAGGQAIEDAANSPTKKKQQ